MRLPELFTGISVVIDDQIGNEVQIDNLIEQIERANIPYVSYEALPDEAVIKHFENISFILLDWNLHSEINPDVHISRELRKYWALENIEFIKNVREVSFTPIFIFTNELPDDVKKILEHEGVYQNNRPNHIFIQSKRHFWGQSKLIKEIEEWAKKNTSVYTLKVWEHRYNEAKTKLFGHLMNLSPSWPRLLWETYKEDNINPAFELGESISRNLYSRMKPIKFDEQIIGKRAYGVANNELREVLEGEKFLKENLLYDDSFIAGDVFKIKGKWYINIRPDCDCIPSRNNGATSLDDVELYLLRGDKIDVKKEKSIFLKDYGHFQEQVNQTVVFSMINRETYIFKFKELKIMRWNIVKDKRKGRLLPPYITQIQQRYSHYLQRQGLTRIPLKAVKN